MKINLFPEILKSDTLSRVPFIIQEVDNIIVNLIHDLRDTPHPSYLQWLLFVFNDYVKEMVYRSLCVQRINEEVDMYMENAVLTHLRIDMMEDTLLEKLKIENCYVNDKKYVKYVEQQRDYISIYINESDSDPLDESAVPWEIKRTADLLVTLDNSYMKVPDSLLPFSDSEEAEEKVEYLKVTKDMPPETQKLRKALNRSQKKVTLERKKNIKEYKEKLRLDIKENGLRVTLKTRIKYRNNYIKRLLAYHANLSDNAENLTLDQILTKLLHNNALQSNDNKFIMLQELYYQRDLQEIESSLLDKPYIRLHEGYLPTATIFSNLSINLIMKTLKNSNDNGLTLMKEIILQRFQLDPDSVVRRRLISGYSEEDLPVCSEEDLPRLQEKVDLEFITKYNNFVDSLQIDYNSIIDFAKCKKAFFTYLEDHGILTEPYSNINDMMTLARYHCIVNINANLYFDKHFNGHIFLTQPNNLHYNSLNLFTVWQYIVLYNEAAFYQYRSINYRKDRPNCLSKELYYKILSEANLLPEEFKGWTPELQKWLKEHKLAYNWFTVMLAVMPNILDAYYVMDSMVNDDIVSKPLFIFDSANIEKIQEESKSTETATYTFMNHSSELFDNYLIQAYSNVEQAQRFVNLDKHGLLEKTYKIYNSFEDMEEIIKGKNEDISGWKRYEEEFGKDKEYAYMNIHLNLDTINIKGNDDKKMNKNYKPMSQLYKLTLKDDE